MNVVVALEHRFVRVGGNTYSSVFTHEHTWSRYLKTFDKVYVLARVTELQEVPTGKLLASAPNVHFLDLPTFIGPYQYLRARSAVARITKQAAELGDSFVLRVPGTIGTGLWKQLRKQRRPFGVEVVGDPWDVFSPKASTSKLRPFLRRYFTSNLKQQCREAVAAAYVTREHLQKRYPPGGWSTNYSSVMLPEEAFLTSSQIAEKQRSLQVDRSWDQPWVLVNVGSMDQVYKRQDILIRAVHRLQKKGLPVHAVLVGDGCYRARYEALVAELGLEKSIHFTGSVQPGAGVREAMDQADVFVLSSETEGLARVLIEASARGLPIASTNVGGCGEIVAPSEMVPPDSPELLANKLSELLTSGEKMGLLANTNWQNSKNYRREILAKRANDFCQQLHQHCKSAHNL